MALVLDERFNLGIPTKSGVGGLLEPYANNTVALLHGDGAVHSSTTIANTSDSGVTVTRTNVTISTEAARFGSGSIRYYNTANTTIDITNQAAVDLTTGDFTVETWFYTAVAPAGTTLGTGCIGIYDRLATGGSGPLYGIFVGSSVIGMHSDGVITMSKNRALYPKTWYHIAFTREGSVYRLFVDGELQCAYTGSSSFTASTAGHKLGKYANATSFWDGFFDNYRITKGVSRYNANFAPPTTAFPLGANDAQWANVGLLLQATGTNTSTVFPDSTTGSTWTASNATVSTSQMYGNLPTMKFTGATNSYASTATSTNWDFGTGDFTIETYVYIDANSPADGGGFYRAGICGPNTASVGTTYWTFMMNGDGTNTGTGFIFESYYNGTNDSKSVNVTISKNVWHHIAVSRDSNGFYFCLDGVIYPQTPINQPVNNVAATGINVGRCSALSTYERPLNGYMSEFRITKGIARYTPTNLPPAFTYDRDFSNVALLLKGDGSNGSTTFTDSSPAPKTVTANGNAQISTAQSKFGGASMYFDGTTYLTTPNNSAYYMDGDGTIEGWMYPTSVTGTKTILDKRNAVNSQVEYQLLILAGKLYLDVIPAGGILSLTGTTTIVVNNWYHFAATRQGNTWMIFLNGVLEASGTVSGAYISNTDPMIIGWPGVTGSAWYYQGYLDDLRITKGVARYTANFSVPTEQHTSNGIDTYSSDVVLLLKDSFSDRSLYKKAFTTFGNVAMSTDQYKFGGSSMYFDGSGDYLSTPNNADFSFGSGNFTIEAWVRLSGYPVNNNGQYQMVIISKDGLTTREFTFGFMGTASSFTSLYLLSFESTAVYDLTTASYSFQLGTWYHVAAVRSGTLAYLFVDGVLLNAGGTTHSKVIQSVNKDITIGTSGYGGTSPYYFNGYIDDLRVTKGVGRYTANFTPTNTFTISQHPTSTLLHFDGSNGSSTFTDERGRGWINTGTPTISTTQSKFGGSSGYFTAGNYITTPYSLDFDLGVNPFTFECWYYVPTGAPIVGGQVSLISAGRQDLSAIGGGWNFNACIGPGPYPRQQYRFEKCLTNGTNLKYRFESTDLFVYDTWNHVAVVRDGFGAMHVYHNGKRFGSTALFSNVTLPVPNNLSIMVGSGGGVSTPNNWPMHGYIDELRLVKGVAIYENEFTPPVSPFVINTVAAATYTQPLLLPNSQPNPFATNRLAPSATLSASYNSTYNSVDLVGGVANSVYDISSVTGTIRGEVEIDLEAVSGNIAGLWLCVNAGDGGAVQTSGYLLYHASNTYIWSMRSSVGATTMGATTAVVSEFNSDGDTSTAPTVFNTAGDRRLLSISWDGDPVDKTKPNIAFRIDGILIFECGVPWKWHMRPGVYQNIGTYRCHGIRMWDTPRIALGKTQAVSNIGITSKLLRYTFNVTSGPIGTKGIVKQLYRWLLDTSAAWTSTTQVGAGLQAKIGFREMVYWPNNAIIKGTVNIHGTPDYAVKRQVMLFDESIKANTMFALSDRITGEYTFNNIDPAKRYTIFAWDEFDRTYKAVISDYQIASKQSVYTNNSMIRLSGNTITVGAAGLIGADVGLVEGFITESSLSVVLHADSLLDSGPKRLGVTKGTAASPINTSQKAFGSSSFRSVFDNTLIVDGSGGEFDFGSGDFSIEFQLMINSGTASYAVLQYGDWGTYPGTGVCWLVYYSGSTLYLYASGDGVSWSVASARVIRVSPPLNVWHHIGIICQSGITYLLFNGVQQQSFNTGAYFNTPHKKLYVMSGAGNYVPFDGWIDEIVITKGTRKTHKSFTVPTAPHVTDQATILLLHADDTNGSVNIVDSSTTNTKTMTAYGTAQISTAQSKFGGSSLAFGTSTANYISGGAASMDYVFNKSMTIDFWFYMTAYNSNGGRMICAGGGGGGAWNSTNGIHWLIQGSATGISMGYWVVSTQAGATIPCSLNTWHHVALVFDKTNNVNSFWLNGTLYWNQYNLITPPSTTPTLNIGAIPGESASASFAFSGYLDEVRISNGANYDSYYHRKTPVITYDRRTGADSANVKLLVHGNVLTDVSGNSNSITNTGVTVNLSERVLGQPTLYFNGSSYFSVENTGGVFDVGTGDFTLEFWINANATTGLQDIIGTHTSAANEAARWKLQAAFTGGAYELRFINYGGVGFAFTKVAPTNTWAHITLSKVNNVIYAFINGELITTMPHTTTVNMGSYLTVGAGSSSNFATNAFTGYMSELRYTTLGRYTKGFSVEYLPFA